MQTSDSSRGDTSNDTTKHIFVTGGVVSSLGKGLTAASLGNIFFAILSIIAGIIVLFAPVWGVAVLWWILGISLIVLGIINVVRAFTFKGDI